MKAKTSFFNWTLPHPIIIPSGPLTNNIALIKKAFEQGACAAVTKTISCERKSYQGIRHFPDKITFNQEGYSSRSPSEWAADWPALQGQPVIANIHGNSPSAFAGLAEYLVRSGAEILEAWSFVPYFWGGAGLLSSGGAGKNLFKRQESRASSGYRQSGSQYVETAQPGYGKMYS